MAEDKKYTGKATEIVVLTDHIDVPVGEKAFVYGVDCEHREMEVGKDKEKAHVLVASVPEQLAKEMIASKRAHLLDDVQKSA